MGVGHQLFLSFPAKRSLTMQPLTTPELAVWRKSAPCAKPVLLDVHELWKFHACQFDFSLQMPINTVSQAERAGLGGTDRLHLPPQRAQRANRVFFGTAWFYPN
jgi:hypothetical protein